MSLRSAAAAAFMFGVLAATPAAAQGLGTGIAAELQAIEARPILALQNSIGSLAPAQQIQMPVQMPGPSLNTQPYYRVPSRPSWVLPMHVVTAVMQGLDAHSTFKALNAGGVESNAMMSGVAHKPGAFTAVKLGVTAGLIFATEHMAKKHPKRAFITAIAINSAYAMIAAHNYRVAGGAR
jgi:hypothetical protein